MIGLTLSGKQSKRALFTATRRKRYTFKINPSKGEFMPENKPTREQLERRRDEIHAQLSRVNEVLQIELDRDPEEQAIQLEQDEVSIALENNLRKELAI